MNANNGPWYAEDGPGWFVIGAEGRSLAVAAEPTAPPRPLALPRVLGVDARVVDYSRPVFGPGGRVLAVPATAELPRYAPGARGLLDRVLRRPVGTELRSVVRLYDPATGRTLGTLPAEAGEYRVLAFAPDGRTFSTERYDWAGRTPDAGVPDVFEQWAVPSPWPPAWLLGMTAGAVLLAAADRWRSRRRRAGLSAAAAGGYPALQGGPPP